MATAIIGAGKTALQYDDKAEISIALNGAIELDYNYDYVCMIDARMPYKRYWQAKPEVVRLLGANIASKCKLCYPDIEERQVYGPVDWPGLKSKLGDPIFPNIVFDLEELKLDQKLDLNVKGAYIGGSVAIPALHMAYKFGHKDIYLYGIGLYDHQYYHGYENRATGCKMFGEVATYMNKLISTMVSQGYNIYSAREENSKLRGVKWLK